MTTASDARLARPQVLLGPMTQLLADLVRQALAHAQADIELLPQGHGVGSLRAVGDAQAPPIVVVGAVDEATTAFERELLRARPEAVVLRIERRGRRLVSQALYAKRTDLGELTARRLQESIGNVQAWNERF